MHVYDQHFVLLFLVAPVDLPPLRLRYFLLPIKVQTIRERAEVLQSRRSSYCWSIPGAEPGDSVSLGNPALQSTALSFLGVGMMA